MASSHKKMRTYYKHEEKVLCLYCNDEVVYKNLKKHTDTKHDKKPLNYKAADTQNIVDMFKKVPVLKPDSNVLSKEIPGITTEVSELPESMEVKSEIEEPEPNEVNVSIDVNASIKSQESNTLAGISQQLNEMTSTIKELVKENKMLKQKQYMNNTQNSNESKSVSGLNLEQQQLLIKNSRSVQSILDLLGKEFILVQDGIRCFCCNITLEYDYLTEGDDFPQGKSLPKSFSNLKISICRHLSCDSHTSSKIKMQNTISKEKELLERGKDFGLNCAAAAYTGFYFSESRYSYEHHITDMYNAGGQVGSKNHSFNFPQKFRPHVYDVLRSTIVNYVLSNNLPFGLLADKMTTKHLTRHMIGIRIPVWDIRHSNISRDIYVQCSCVRDLSGRGIASHMIESLDSFGLDEAFQREHLSGCAMDGQYVKLNIKEHLNKSFLKNYHLTWDPAHVIELSLKDCCSKNGKTQNFIEHTSDIIQSTMKLLSYGHAYLELLDNRDLSDHFLTPKIFKSLKFVGHCSSVLDSFDSNFSSIVSTLTSINDEESVGLLESILNVDFILDFLFMKDVMGHLTLSSKLVQKNSALPWHFPCTIDSLMNTLNACLNNLSEDNVKRKQLNCVLFPNFSHCFDIVQNKVYKDSPLLDIPMSTPLTRNRSSTIESENVSEKSIEKYKEYITALLNNLTRRFLSDDSTYQLCKVLGGLFDFSWLLNPSICDTYTVSDIESLSIAHFKKLLDHINFAPCKEHEITDLFFQYKLLWKFACNSAKEARANFSPKNLNLNYLKNFVYKNKDCCPVMCNFLSFVVSLPTSEAIVESWGSTIDYLHKCKRNVAESTDTHETGTVDKLAFIKLNGPPPGLKANKKFLKAALTLMFKGCYAKHFTHSGQSLGTTSKVVTRITEGEDTSTLPCFF